MKPQLLGYIFDVLAKVLKRKQEGNINVKGLPSLADWGEWCELISQEMGNNQEVFIEAFNRNIEAQNEAAIEDSVIAEAIIYLMENQTRWYGTAAPLLAQLETFAPLLGIHLFDYCISHSTSYPNQKASPYNELVKKYRHSSIT